MGKDSCTPEPVPCPSLSFCPLSTNRLLNSLPNPTRGWCDRGTDDHRPVQHATCRSQGQPAGKSCLGFYTVSPQALTGVSRDTEHPPPHPDTWLRLLGQEAGLCDPGPVTEPFHPSAEKGSLVPESHWVQWPKTKGSLERCSCRSAQEGESVNQCLEKDPSSRHDSGDPFPLPTAGELP